MNTSEPIYVGPEVKILMMLGSRSLPKSCQKVDVTIVGNSSGACCEHLLGVSLPHDIQPACGLYLIFEHPAGENMGTSCGYSSLPCATKAYRARTKRPRTNRGSTYLHHILPEGSAFRTSLE